ncbi:MAG: UDP-3-O-acyl-N-acetylglucosamine deacetylase [Alphaproteobacteria bacterium]
MKQYTLEHPVSIKGIGLHSGMEANLTINPAPANSGITFQRIDLEGKPQEKAIYSNIKDTRNSSSMSLVSTVEHLMSALYMTGIDNALIEIDGPEIPIMDGSAKPFLGAFKDLNLIPQDVNRKILKIKENVSFADNKGNLITLEPAEKLEINFEINFPSPIVGNQKFSGDISEEILSCRTFVEKQQVDYLQSIGLIKGGSLENAVVLDGNTLLNKEGWRCENECVKHKVLDAIGDLYLSGYHIIGKLTANKTGHFHTNELLKLLFSNPNNYEVM